MNFTILNAGDEPFAATRWGQFYGPWEYGGKLWTLQADYCDSGIFDITNLTWNPNLRMYFTANRQSWTEADSANRPLNYREASAFRDGNVVYVVYAADAYPCNLAVVTFDLTTGLWGVPVTGGPAPGGYNLGVFVTRRSDGSLVVLYGATVSGTSYVRYVKFVGGVWGAPVNVSTDVHPCGILLDSADLVHFFWTSPSSAPSQIYHRTLDATDTLGASQATGGFVAAAGDSYSTNITSGPPVLFDGKVMMPFPEAPGSDVHYPSLLIGDPAGSDSPSWSIEPISTVTSVGARPLHNSAFIALVVDGSDLVVYWATDMEGVTSPWVWFNELYRNRRSGGVWDTDELVFSPSSPTNPNDDFIHNISVMALADGTLYPLIQRVNPSFDAVVGNEYDATYFPEYTPPVPPSPGPGQLGSTRTILHIWQQAVSPQVEITKDRKGDWTNCGTPSNKFFQGVKIVADTFGAAKSLAFRDADTGALHYLQPASITHSGRRPQAYSFEAPFLAHSVRHEPQDLVPWRNFGIEYIWEPSPEAVQTWKTQWTAHGLNGYMHIHKIDAAYEASSNVTLTIQSLDGTSPAVLTLPSTGGVEGKILLILTFNKGQAYQYTATSGGRFRLFLNDWIVWIGQWGRTSPYLAYRALGGEIGDKARI